MATAIGAILLAAVLAIPLGLVLWMARVYITRVVFEKKK